MSIVTRRIRFSRMHKWPLFSNTSTVFNPSLAEVILRRRKIQLNILLCVSIFVYLIFYYFHFDVAQADAFHQGQLLTADFMLCITFYNDVFSFVLSFDRSPIYLHLEITQYATY